MYYDDFFRLFSFFPLLWLASIVAAPMIAGFKGRSVILWLLIGVVSGPVGLLIIALLPNNKPAQAAQPGLEKRILDLEQRVWILESGFKPAPAAKPQPAIKPEPVVVPIPVKAPVVSPELHVALAIKEERKHPDLEQKMGRYWLNRIGILVLATGVAFLISYTFKYFGPFVKILTGYLIALALYAAGMRLEKKDRFIYYGRTLLGGAWAIAYFTTYAMYHFPASRVIQSQLLDLVLLAVVATAMLWRSLRYKSQELSSMALFVGYFTATMGDINYFTLVSCLFLAIISVVLVYKMRWLRMIFVGIALTYITHIFWVVKQVRASFVPAGQLDLDQVQFWLNNGFIFLYWLVFTASIYLIKNLNEKEEKQLAVANFSNFLPFFVLAYSKIYTQYPDFKFPFVLGLGIVYAVLALVSSRMKNGLMSTVNTLIALSLITFSIPLKAVPLSTTVIWLFELPCILYIGNRFGKKSFRIFGLLLAAAVFIRMVSFDFAGSRNLVLFIGAVSSYLSVLIARRIKAEEGFWGEKLLVNAYSLFGTVYLTTFIWDMVAWRWLGAALFEEAFALAFIAFFLKDKAFRLYSYMLAAAASVVMLFAFNGHNFIWVIAQMPLMLLLGLRFNIRQVRILAIASGAVLFIKAVIFDYRLFYTIPFLNNIVTWREFILFIGLASMFLCDHLYRRLDRGERFAGEQPLAKVYSALGTAYLTLFLWDMVPLRWLSLAWAFETAGLFFAGYRMKAAYFRVYSVILLAMVSVRMVFIDERWGFDAISWLAFAAEMAIFSSMYFLYKGMKERKEVSELEKAMPVAVFTVAALVATSVIFEQVERNFISLALGVEGAVMFALGFAARDKVMRIGGFAVFGLTLARIVLVDMAHVAVIYKIISFMALGAIFLVTSFLYNKYNVGKDK